MTTPRLPRKRTHAAILGLATTQPVQPCAGRIAVRSTLRAKAIMAALYLAYPTFEAPHRFNMTNPELAAGLSEAGGVGAGVQYLHRKRARLAVESLRTSTKSPFLVNYVSGIR
jgi:hypothetical protein